MSNRDIIYIPEDAKDIPITYFPISNNLQNFLRRQKIKLVSDLKQLSPETILEIIYNKKKPFSELKQLIIAIQESNSKEIIFTQEDTIDDIERRSDNLSFDEEIEDDIDEIEPITTLNNLIKFINEFVAELKGDDKEIFLGRLGAASDERVIPMFEICGKYKLSPDFVGQTLAAFTNEVKTYIGQDGYKVLSKLSNDCLEAVCPLTPQFLVYLTNNDYSLFFYPPAFYIRLIGKLSPKIPILPEYENRIKYLETDAAKMSKQIKLFLKEFYLPVSLTEVFNRVTSSSVADKDSAKVFFEAIQSAKFNLIKTNNPKEVFIELREKGKF